MIGRRIKRDRMQHARLPTLSNVDRQLFWGEIKTSVKAGEAHHASTLSIIMSGGHQNGRHSTNERFIKAQHNGRRHAAGQQTSLRVLGRSIEQVCVPPPPPPVCFRRTRPPQQRRERAGKPTLS